jgi:hypothetical protein
VANGAGKDAADDVVVMVTEVGRLEDSENPVTEARPIMLPLAWSGSSPPLTVGPVHPGSERHVDLVHVDWPARDEVDIACKWRDNGPARLALTPKPAGDQETLQPGTYEISVEVRARNADAIRYAVPLTWDGKWTGKAEMWDHLRVEPPRKAQLAVPGPGKSAPTSADTAAQASTREVGCGPSHVATRPWKW